MIKQINPLTTILVFILRASVCQTLPVATPAWLPPLPTEMARSHTGRSFYWLIIDHREFYINKLIYQKPPWPTFAFCTIAQHTQQRCGDPSAVPHMVEVEGSNWLHAKKKDDESLQKCYIQLSSAFTTDIMTDRPVDLSNEITTAETHVRNSFFIISEGRWPQRLVVFLGKRPTRGGQAWCCSC